MNWQFSPFIVPVAGCMVAIVAIIASYVSEGHKARLRADQRMTMVARGMNAEEIEKVLGKVKEEARPPAIDPIRSLNNIRLTASILLCGGAAVVMFGLLLAWIVNVREVLVVAAAGLIALGIGFGFLVDYRMQKKDMVRFGMELDPHE